MNEFVDIIVIYIVLRAILAFLGAWWMETDATISDETDKRIGLNSFVYYFSMTYTSMPKECQFPF